jgi:four helix bundle protein
LKYNILAEKSYAFSVRATRMYQYLLRSEKEYILSKQFVRAATSIGANIEEAIGAQTRKMFISKMSIAFGEARETHYWIRLLTETDYIEPKAGASMLEDCTELLKIMTALLKSSKALRDQESEP